MTRPGALLAALALSAGLWWALTPPARASVAGGRRVALVGESHAQVVWPVLAPMLRAKGYDVVYQVAKPGWSAARFAQDADVMAAVRASRPDVLVVLASGNNALTSEGSYRELVTTYAAIAPRLLWVGPSVATKSPYRETHARTRALEARVVPGLATWLDSFPVTSTGQRDDGVHFTSTAYRAWAQAIQAAL